MVLGHQLLIPTLGETFQDRVLATSPLAYWPLDDNGGAVARELVNGWDGVYSGTTWDGTLSRHGRPVPRFDGVASYVDIFSAALSAAFDFDEYTLLLEFKAFNTGVWTDGVARRLLRLQRDGSNETMIRRQATNNTLRFLREGNTTITNIDPAGFNDTLWQPLGLSASVVGGGLLTAGDLRAYLSAAQLGATVVGNIAATGAGLNVNRAVIGAADTSPTLVTNGYIGNVVLYATPMTQDILDLQA